jgi:hypothetical protein
MATLSRNEISKYSYFFVVKNNKRLNSTLKQNEFFVYKFENPVSAARGKALLTDAYTTDVYEMSDDFYQKESFTHPSYRNQKNEFIKFKYTLVPVVAVTADQSRNI